MSDIPLTFWQWVVGGCALAFTALGSLIVKSYEKRIANLEKADTDLWREMAGMKSDDRSRWERFEARIGDQFSEVRKLILDGRLKGARDE